MLLSPVLLTHGLSQLLSQVDADGPHTALLATPQGRIIASSRRKYTNDNESPHEPDDGRTRNAEQTDGSRYDGAGVGAAAVDGDTEQEDDAEEQDEEEEPYLDEPERMRLLLGLASQWTQDESPRIECEVSPRRKPFYLGHSASAGDTRR